MTREGTKTPLETLGEFIITGLTNTELETVELIIVGLINVEF